MLSRLFWWRLLALLLTALWLPARAQTLPNNGFPSPEAAADHAHHDHFFQQIRTDARISSGFLLDYGLGLADMARFSGQAGPVNYTGSRAASDTTSVDSTAFEFASAFAITPPTDSGTAGRVSPIPRLSGGVADLPVWYRVYATLLTSGVGAAGAWLPTLKTINARLDANTFDVLLDPTGRRTQPVNLLLLGADYQRLRTEAEDVLQPPPPQSAHHQRR